MPSSPQLHALNESKDSSGDDSPYKKNGPMTINSRKWRYNRLTSGRPKANSPSNPGNPQDRDRAAAKSKH